MDSEARFARYIESLAGVLGHVDRAEPLRDYCTGLLMPVACVISAHPRLRRYDGRSGRCRDAPGAR